MEEIEKDYVELDLTVMNETASAFSLTDGDNQEWVPKSQIYYDESEAFIGSTTQFQIPEWLAIEKGFI